MITAGDFRKGVTIELDASLKTVADIVKLIDEAK